MSVGVALPAVGVSMTSVATIPVGTSGFLVSDGAGGFVTRTLQQNPSIQISNSDGTGGDPTIAANISNRYIITKLLGASLNTTNDQTLTLSPNISRYYITNIIFTNASATPVLAAGGLYAGTGKTNGILSSSTVYTTLIGGSIVLAVNTSGLLSLGQQIQTSPTLYFSLTTANIGAVTMDIYVEAIVLS